MGLLLAVYITALYKLQIFDAAADDDAQLVKNTTKKTETLTADRGDILDRNGIQLVTTRAAYNVTLHRERFWTGRYQRHHPRAHP
jgi:cell division protein FtsI/penicillin-binding protein 2